LLSSEKAPSFFALTGGRHSMRIVFFPGNTKVLETN
jgi:hypothetical protein